MALNRVFFKQRNKINLITLSVGIYLLSAIVFHLIENPIRYGQLLKGKSIYSLLIIPIILFVGINLSYQTEIKRIQSKFDFLHNIRGTQQKFNSKY